MLGASVGQFAPSRLQAPMDRLNLVDLGYELVAMTLHCGDGARRIEPRCVPQASPEVLIVGPSEQQLPDDGGALPLSGRVAIRQSPDGPLGSSCRVGELGREDSGGRSVAGVRGAVADRRLQRRVRVGGPTQLQEGERRGEMRGGTVGIGLTLRCASRSASSCQP